MLFFVPNFLVYSSLNYSFTSEAMRYIFLYSIVLILGLFTALQAKETDSLALEYPYINYTTKDGLPSNETFCVLQDSRGYIWIGTDRGLVKYDGYEFKTYTTLDGLTDNVILAINEDDKGNIWYTGLNSLEIGYIDPKMGFHKYIHNKELIEEVKRLMYPRIHFNDIYFDREDIYIVNRRYGYIIINKKGIKHVDIRINKTVKAIETRFVTHENWQFIYSYHGLTFDVNRPVNIHNLDNEMVYSYDKVKLKYINPTVLKKDSTLYIYDSYNHFILNDSVTDYSIMEEQCSAFELSRNLYIYSIYGDNDKDGTVYYSNSPNIHDEKTHLINGVRIINGILDSNGGIWLSTLRKGIFYFPNLNSKFSNLENPIHSLVPQKKGVSLYTKTQQLFYDYETNKIEYNNRLLNYRDTMNYFSNIGFFNLIQIDLKLKEAGELYNTCGIKGIQNLSDSLKYVWASGYIGKIKRDKISHTKFWHEYGDKLPFQESLFCFEEDSCLYGTRDGLFLYRGDDILDLNKEKKKRIRHIDYFKQSNVLVYSIWGEGLVLKYKNNKEFRLSDKEGLVSNTINVFFMDTDERLWIGTNKGINRLSIDDITGEYILETINNGSNNLSSPNILQLYYRNNILYLGTDSGFDIINLKLEEKETKTDLPFVLDALEINNKPYSITNKSIVLSYDSNSLTFYYTAIVFNLFGQVNYRYKLDGLSNQWIYTNERKAIFLNIASGNYKFFLQAQNEYGEWIGIKEPLTFTINKPYWETWWFRFIILGVLGYIIYYYISNFKREQEFLKQEKRLLEDKQRLSDKLNESQQKALSSQLNPHFVFNSLNSIQNFILTKRTELSSDYLSTFSKLMRFVFENSKKLYVPLSDEIEALKLYLELEQVRHNHKFDYNIDSRPLRTEGFFIPSLLIQPIIENAIWHGLLHKLENNRLLEICFTSDSDYLHIEVKDNGVGRGSSKPRPKFIKKQKSSGIELTKQRLDLLSQSTGLNTKFEIKDLYNEAREACGTQVIISIPNKLSI